MIIEKKLIAVSVIALLIGVSSVIPMVFLMSEPAKAATFDDPWFNINVPYAYYSANSTIYSYQTKCVIALNFTVNADAITEYADGRVEYYEFQIYGDHEQITNVTYFLARNSSKVVDPISMFHFTFTNGFNSTAAGGGLLVTNLTAPLPLLRTGESTRHSDETGNWRNTNRGKIILEIENANTIYLDVRRLGYITFTENNTIVTLADNQVIQHLALTKKGDAFTYGEPPNESMLMPGELPYPEPQQ
jgi:hypothetical protein